MDACRERLQKVFESTDTDVIVLPNGVQPYSNFFYTTGVEGGLFEGATALLTEDGTTLLLSVLSDENALRRVSRSVHVRKFSTGKEAESMIRKYTKGKVVGFDGAALPFNSHRKMKVLAEPRRMVDVSGVLEDARSVKGEDEIENIRHAVRIAKRAFSDIENSFKPGITEKELASNFDSLVEEQGSSNSFETIVCFGKNSSIPHHVSDSTRLKPNSLILIDAGAKHNGYCSDITRTFMFRPDKSSASYGRMADMYETVKGAQRAALEAAKSGAYGDSVHKAAEETINRHNGGIYKGKFIHGLGHSIGIDVHDSEKWALAPRCHQRIREGMVFSDEPGIYVEGFGGVRIEDDILITQDEATML